MSYLSDQLREHGPSFGLGHLCDEAADALDSSDARIAELEAQLATVAPAVDAQPVAWLVTSKRGLVRVAWADKPTPEQLAACEFDGDTVTPLYASAQSAGLRKDAEQYRWLRDTLHGAKAGGGVEVNNALQFYEKPHPGEEVRIYWYQDTPVGFCEVKASTLGAAIDSAVSRHTGEKS